jgi:nucleoside-diphosphate-sugar epimerase
MMPARGSTILLTGITGFLAKHVMLALLEAGFNVRGTLRNISKAGDVHAVVEAAGYDVSRVTFAVADLTLDAGWPEAAAGCAGLVHTASPFHIDVSKDKMVYVEAARGGTLRVLNSAYAAGIRRAVITSSLVAIQYGHHDSNGRTFNEADWTNTGSSEVDAYPMSKTLAERAAWAFAKAHVDFELSAINPGFILGPLLDTDAGTSANVIKMMLDGKYPGVPDLLFSIVDARDVADAHVKALTLKDAAGERFICTGEPMKFIDIAATLRNALPERGRKLPKFVVPKAILRVVALIDPAIKLILPEIGVKMAHDNSKSKRILGLTYRDSSEAVASMGRSLVELKLA